MTAPRPLSALKGRDLRALAAFRDRLRAALGKSLVSVTFLSRRPLEVPPEATAPAPKGAPGGGLALQPAPEPPGELRVLVKVDRRDVWVEDRVDGVGLEVALETGALVSPLVYAEGDLDAPLARASRIAAELCYGEALP